MKHEQLNRANELRNEMERLHASLPTFVESETGFAVVRSRVGTEAFETLRAEYAKVLNEQIAVLVREFEAL